MNRSNRFISGLISGYGAIGANVVFTLASVPIALHYLSKDEFGLWILAAQVAMYLALIDLGMHQAVSRFLVDHKDDVDGGAYGSHLSTGAIVFLIQGLLIAGVGLAISIAAPSFFEVPRHLNERFQLLLGLLGGLTGISIVLRSVSSPLWAFQRNDVIKLVATVTTLLNLLVLWLCLRAGLGVFAFLYAQLPLLIVTPLASYIVCQRNHYYPSKGCWGSPSWKVFQSTFRYGKDLLLVSMGTLLVNASQIMIITRFVNLQAALAYSIFTKMFNMGMMLIANPVASASAGLTELHVREQTDLFVARFWDIATITLALSTMVGVCLVTGNSAFVDLWTGKHFEWPWLGDSILALLILLRNMNGCFLNLFGLTKNLRPVRYIYFGEGIVFVGLAILLAPKYGVLGVLIASLISHLAITSTLSAKAASRVVGSINRIRSSCIHSIAIVAVAFVTSILARQADLGSIQTLALGTIVSIVAAGAIWLFVVPREFRDELRSRIYRFMKPFRHS